MNFPIQRINRHIAYTSKEIKQLLGVSIQALRHWTGKQQLRPLNPGGRLLFFSGEDLYKFLQNRKLKKQHKLKKGEFYCLRCNLPRKSKPEAIKEVKTDTLINAEGAYKLLLCGECEVCGLKVRRWDSHKTDSTN